MTIFGKPLSSYVSFALPAMLLMALVGLTRLVLSLQGAPFGSTRWVSMNLALFLCVLYLGVHARTTGFGGYKHLLPAFALVSVTFHVIAIAGILLGIATSQDNVYTVPEAAFGEDGKTLFHAFMHVAVGMPAVALIGWLEGSLVFLVAKKVIPGPAAD